MNHALASKLIKIKRILSGYQKDGESLAGRLTYLSRLILGKTNACRHLTVFPDDVFLVSYPRSGNTWARFLLGNLISQDEAVTFLNIEHKIPDIYCTRNRELKRIPRPRLLKSHEVFDARYKKVIYIVRDPRDVAVSYYYWNVKRRYLPEGYSIERSVSSFIAAELEPECGSWGEHVACWVAPRQLTGAMLIVRYEDMLENPEHELGKIAAFLNINPTEGRLARAVSLSSAENMRVLERKESHSWRTTSKTRQDKPFVGPAMAGRWRSELPESSVAEIESAWWPVMRLVGYSPMTCSGPTTLAGDFESLVTNLCPSNVS